MTQDKTNTGVARPYGIAAASSIVLWWLIVLFDGVPDAWDADVFFPYVYVLQILICIGLGWIFHYHAWSYGFILCYAQLVPMLIPPDDLDLLPLAVVLLFFLALPMVITGGLTSWIRRRFFLARA